MRRHHGAHCGNRVQDGAPAVLPERARQALVGRYLERPELTATSTGLTAATSSGFDITPGPASKLGFSVQPSNTTAGTFISPAVQVAVPDAFGHVVTSSGGRSVTIIIGKNPADGTLSGTATTLASYGVATFSSLSIDKAGNGYTLSAVSGT